MSNNRPSKRQTLANLAALSMLAIGMAGCSGGGSTAAVDTSPTTTPTASVIGTVPGTLIEAFCDNGSYYSTNSIQNGTARHPFSLDLPADLGCQLVMTTNEGIEEEVVSPIGFLDSDNTMHTRLVFTENSIIDLGYVPLPMNRAAAANNDVNGDGILDAPFILDNYHSHGANNPLLQNDADEDGVNDWQDPDHGGNSYMAGTINPMDEDNDGVPNRYDEDFTPHDNDSDSDGLPDNMDANPDNHRHGNTHMEGDNDNDGYHDNDRNRDGFDDDDTDRDGTPDRKRTTLGDINQGAILFGTYCSGCHQPDGSDLSAATPEAVSTAVNSIAAMSSLKSLLAAQDFQCLSAFINRADHDSGWNQEDNHGDYTDNNGVDVCAACHGPDLGGDGNIPSCYTCHDNEWGAGPQPLPPLPNPPAGNIAPVANAGPDQNLTTGDTVTLNGSASSDINNDSLTYQWTITGRPAGSSAALSDAAAVNPTFIADVAGTYTVRLVVNDGQTDSISDIMTVTASAAPTANVAPVADAGTNQNVTTGNTVNLNGAGSSDANGDSLAYNWTMAATPNGSAAVLADTTTVNSSFSADLAGTYTVNLVVNDGRLNSNTDTVTITATDPAPALNGALLYNNNCSGCHGSGMSNRSAAQINAAISANRGGMSFLSALTMAEIDAIAVYLGP